MYTQHSACLPSKPRATAFQHPLTNNNIICKALNLDKSLTVVHGVYSDDTGIEIPGLGGVKLENLGVMKNVGEKRSKSSNNNEEKIR